jgi:hypothetical protein
MLEGARVIVTKHFLYNYKLIIFFKFIGLCLIVYGKNF